MDVGWLTSIYQLKNEWGIAWTMVVMLLFVLGYLIIQHLKKRAGEAQKKFDDISDAISMFRSSHISSDSGKVISLDTQYQLIKGIHENLESLRKSMDENRTEYAKYHSNISNIVDDINQINKSVEQFVKDGQDSRKVTQEIIGSIANKLDGLGIEVLATLRASLGIHGQDRKQ